MKKRIPAVILMFALFLSTSFAANAYKKSIEVEYGITVEFNDQQISMTDANGKPVDAFVYQGTTYVPIRAISETFGADVGYDPSTNTAYVYDDFTEIITAAYKLHRTISVCMNTIDTYESAIDANSFENSPYEDEQDIQAFIDRDADMLKTLSEENVNYSLLSEDLLPLYNQFIDEYKIAANDYKIMYNERDYSNFTNWGNFFSSSGRADITGISYELELEEFLDSFNWRTFDVVH